MRLPHNNFTKGQTRPFLSHVVAKATLAERGLIGFEYPGHKCPGNLWEADPPITTFEFDIRCSMFVIHKGTLLSIR